MNPNMDLTALLDMLIGVSKIKFDTLDQLFGEVKIKQRNVVFHLDLSAVLCRIYQKNGWTIDAITQADPNLLRLRIVIAILNVIAHYRKYLTFRLRKKNIIVVTYNYQLTEHQKKNYPELQRDHMNQSRIDHPLFGPINQAVREAYSYIQAVCSYFDDVFCIDPDTGVDTITTMGLIKNDKRYQEMYHILFTRNLVAGQLCDKNTVILYNKRDQSRLLTEQTVISDGLMMEERRTRKDTRVLAREKLTPHMVPFIITITSTHKTSGTVKKFRWSLEDGIVVILEMLDRKLITGQVSIYSFLDGLEQVMTEKRKKPKKPRKKRKKKIRMGRTFRREMKAWLLEHPEPVLPVITTVVKETSPEFVIDNDTYQELIGRYRSVAYSVTSAAVTKQQILKIYSRMYNLYNQEYLEELNEVLSVLGPNVQFIEISILSQNDPYAGRNTEYDDRW